MDCAESFANYSPLQEAKEDVGTECTDSSGALPEDNLISNVPKAESLSGRECVRTTCKRKASGDNTKTKLTGGPPAKKTMANGRSTRSHGQSQAIGDATDIKLAVGPLTKKVAVNARRTRSHVHSLQDEDELQIKAVSRKIPLAVDTGSTNCSLNKDASFQKSECRRAKGVVGEGNGLGGSWQNAPIMHTWGGNMESHRGLIEGSAAYESCKRLVCSMQDCGMEAEEKDIDGVVLENGAVVNDECKGIESVPFVEQNRLVSAGAHATDKVARAVIRSSLSESSRGDSTATESSSLPQPAMHPLTPQYHMSPEECSDAELMFQSLPNTNMEGTITSAGSCPLSSSLMSMHSSLITSERTILVNGRREPDVQGATRNLSMLSSPALQDNTHANLLLETRACQDDAFPQNQQFLCSRMPSELSDVLNSNAMTYAMTSGPKRFSFQKLINGELSDVEDFSGDEKLLEEGICIVNEIKFEDGRNNRGAERLRNIIDEQGVKAGEDGEDMNGKGKEECKEKMTKGNALLVSTQSQDEYHDSGLALSDTESQHSEDMYHGQKGISSCKSTYPEHARLDYPCFNSMNLVTGTNMNSSGHSSCCLPISDGIALGCRQQVCYENPCLHSTAETCTQTSSNVSADLCMLAEGDAGRDTLLLGNGLQTSSDTSKDLSVLPSQLNSDTNQQTSSLDTGFQASSGTSRDLSNFPSLDAGPQTSSGSSRDFSLSHGVQAKMNVSAESPVIKQVPASAKALLASDHLQGCRVTYQVRGEILLTGVIKNGGILCNCKTCKGRTIVNVSSFEKHAGSNIRHPSDYTFLDNGQSLHDVLKAGWQASDGKYAGTRRKSAATTTEGESPRRLRKAAATSIDGECARSDTRNGSGSGNANTPPPAAHSSLNTDSLVLENSNQRRSDINSSRHGHSSQPSQTKDMNLHKMLFRPGGLPDGTEVAYYVKGQRVLSGTKEGSGIRCGCCNEVISCSSFEAHAGWGSRRNPYLSIFLSDGQSLHEVAVALSAKRQDRAAGISPNDNDDICAECGDGGDLVLCDGCPGAYHIECVGLSCIPEGDWFCSLCQNNLGGDKRQVSRTSVRGGKLLSKERVSERCQRVVKASKNAIGGCVICKNGDFLKSGFGAKTILLCDQCEREYHVGCMKEKGVADLQELPDGEWFCSADCNLIHNVLEGMVLGGPEPVLGSTCRLLREQKQLQATSEEAQPQVCDFTWQLLHGRRNDPHNGKILSEAATIFTESFDPIVDAITGRDLIPPMVYSRSIRDQDFRGMYCAVLKKKEIVVSAAIIRVFGRQFAEMPLVATSITYRGQGYFQMLMASIEQLLRMLRVEYLVLPAAEEAEGIWTNKFGFSKLQDEQLQQFGTEVQIMVFQGSSMLLKALS